MSASGNQPCLLTEQAVGWALHALEPDEEMAVLLHLPQCAVCQAAVRDAENVLTSLGATVEQVEPPRSLRGSILSAAAETPQRLPMLRSVSSPEGVPFAARLPVVIDPPPVQPPTRLSEPRMTRGTWLSRRSRRLVAASLALVGVLTVGGLAVRTSQLEQQRAAETVQAQGIADLITQIGRPGVTHAVLADTSNSTVAAVLVVDGQRQVFSVGLPSNAADRDTYVLWGLGGAAAQPLGTFDVASADQGLRSVGSSDVADKFTGYAISLEPGRVAPAAPTAVVAQGQVQV